MSMLDGVSQCWWLSSACLVNWDAWAAVGTVAAVFAAILAPAIQRRFVRVKANALFALAYQTDITKAAVRMDSLRKQFPLSPESDAAWQVHSSICKGAPSQKKYVALIQGLDALTTREVDITKWASVDLDLAASIAVAIESLKHFQFAAMTIAQTPSRDNWKDLMRSVDSAERLAYSRIERAEKAIDAALRNSKMTARQERAAVYVSSTHAVPRDRRQPGIARPIGQVEIRGADSPEKVAAVEAQVDGAHKSGAVAAEGVKQGDAG